MSRTYDSASRVKKLTYPNSFAVEHVYNSRGYLEAVCSDRADSSGRKIEYWRAAQADIEGRILKSTYGNSVSDNYTYNTRTGRLTNIHSAAPYVIAYRRLRYSYDSMNNVLSRRDTVHDITESYTYDQRGRLKQNTISSRRHSGSIYNATVSYTYDWLDNLTHRSDVGNYTYDRTRPHAPTLVGSRRIMYDANGNRTSRGYYLGGTYYTWTSFNKPSRISKYPSNIQFAYGPDRQRYRRTDNKYGQSSQTWYVGKIYERVTETSSGDVRHKNYIYAMGRRIAMAVQESTSGASTSPPAVGTGPLFDKIYYFHADALGSIDMISNQQGEVVAKNGGYKPFGKQRRATHISSSSGIPLALGYTYRTDRSDLLLTTTNFTGHEKLNNVNQLHMNGRVFDLNSSTFASPDPYTLPSFRAISLNRYAYGRQNPMKYVDPTGYFSTTPYYGNDPQMPGPSEEVIVNGNRTQINRFQLGHAPFRDLSRFFARLQGSSFPFRNGNQYQGHAMEKAGEAIAETASELLGAIKDIVCDDGGDQDDSASLPSSSAPFAKLGLGLGPAFGFNYIAGKNFRGGGFLRSGTVLELDTNRNVAVTVGAEGQIGGKYRGKYRGHGMSVSGNYTTTYALSINNGRVETSPIAEIHSTEIVMFDYTLSSQKNVDNSHTLLLGLLGASVSLTINFTALCSQ